MGVDGVVSSYLAFFTHLIGVIVVVWLSRSARRTLKELSFWSWIFCNMPPSIYSNFFIVWSCLDETVSFMFVPRKNKIWCRLNYFSDTTSVGRSNQLYGWCRTETIIFDPVVSEESDGKSWVGKNNVPCRSSSVDNNAELINRNSMVWSSSFIFCIVNALSKGDFSIDIDAHEERNFSIHSEPVNKHQVLNYQKL